MKLCYTNNIVLKILTVLHLANTITVVSTDDGTILGTTLCNFEATNNAVWNLCRCVTSSDYKEATIVCNRIPWITVPPFIMHANTSQEEPSYRITALKIVNSNLLILPQEAFKNIEPESIDLTYNHISTVHVNAFRSIESKLQQLNLNHNQLASIPTWALAHLHQLNYLSLQSNFITTIKPSSFDGTRLEKLRYLHIDNNQIEHLAKGSLSSLSLHVLTLSNNRIEVIEQLALPKTLWYLDLKNNNLQQIPYLALEGATSLQTLDLEGNNITKVTASADAEFKNPINLLLKYNKIQSLGNNAFQSFRKLRKLDVSYNQITRIYGGVFNSIVELKQLDMSSNRIAYIPVKTFENIGKSLQTLNLEDNYLHILPAPIEDLRALEVMNLNNNKLVTIDGNAWMNMKPALTELLLAYNRLNNIPNKTLDGMKKLQNLDLSKNKIRSIGRLSFGSYEGARTTLKKINLAGNLLKEITDSASFAYMTSLAQLDLSYNQITNLSNNVFLHLENLNFLNLEGNKLEYYPKRALDGLIKLESLILDGNPIQILPDFVLANLKSLTYFSLSKTKLKNLNAEKFHATSTTSLKTLNLAFNEIAHLSQNTFRNIHQIEALFLHNNQLSKLQSTTFSSMKKLRHLSLANNQITTIEERALVKLHALEELSLANNRLHTVAQGSFSNLDNLRYLDLSNNYLRFFDLTFLQQPRILIERLDLSHNHIEVIDLTDIKETLTHLNLASNQFQTIGKGMIHGFDKLQFLDLTDNGIFEIQTTAFEKSVQLRVLKLGKNHLRILKKNTFAAQEKLEVLKLENNEISRIEEGAFGFNNVHLLDLSQNNLEAIPRLAFTSISSSIFSLNLDKNKLKMVDAVSFLGMGNLTKLSLAYNQIEMIEESAFSTLENLLELDLSNNPVLSWNPQAFKGISPSIELLNLAHTGLYSLPRINNHGLRHLNISGNQISELHAKDTSTFKKLETLDVSLNKLKKIDQTVLEAFTQLKALNICNNPIRKIDETFFKYVNQIETLLICHMPVLYQLPQPDEFRRLNSLRHLKIFDTPNLNNYRISEILQNLPAMQILDIEIKEPRLDRQFDKADMRLLRSLTIRGKNLKQLDPTAFIYLRGLKFHLTIMDTSIKEIPAAIFNTLTNVNKLSLSIVDNQLKVLKLFEQTDIPFINQHGTVLEALNIERVTLYCDCNLQWITRWNAYYENRLLEGTSSKNLQCMDATKNSANVSIFYEYFVDTHCNHAQTKGYSSVYILCFLPLFAYSHRII